MSKSYQDWCVDTLTDILGKINDYCDGAKGKSFKYVLSALINHHASLYEVKGGGCKNDWVDLWWDDIKKYDKDAFFGSVLMSMDASKVICAVKDVEALEGLIHFEHIVPRGYALRLLCEKAEEGASVDREVVRDVLRHNKIVILTKCQREYLDGKCARITQDDLKFLETHFSELSDEIDEARKCVGKYPKSMGTALVRLAVLARHIGADGFCMLNGEQLKPKDWLPYLKAPNVIKGNLNGALK